MKHFIITGLLIWTCLGSLHAQISGNVYGEDSQPLKGVSISLVSTARATMTDANGYFELAHISLPDTIHIRYIGYQSMSLKIESLTQKFKLHLIKDAHAIETVEVVNTGFYQIPKERATGSFTQIDNELLNRAVGGSILQRLEGIASGVQFVNAEGTKASDIRVRGLATLFSDATPLIVLDNFPYEGDISTINPNDIAHVSILKDAAAASIWGARAANGVIVITTKQGRYNQKGQLHINSNLTIGMKPDLLYNQNRLPSVTVMEIEREKYEHGGFYIDDVYKSPFPEYVEMLIARDRGELSEADFLKKEELLKNTEVREEMMKYVYQPAQYQQYAVNARGGSDRYNYFVSGGYDRHRSELIGDHNNRINLHLNNTFKLNKQLEINAALWYTEQRVASNGLTFRDLRAAGNHIGLSPYLRLRDEDGQPLPMIKNYGYDFVNAAEAEGLLDWTYRPLADRDLMDKRSKSDELRALVGLRYDFLKHFNMQLNYQYVNGNSRETRLYDKDSYYARNLVNRFTQPDLTRIIPYGGIYEEYSPENKVSHSGRAQVNYRQDVGLDHQFVALAGAEIRELVQQTSPGTTLYGYDPDLMLGTATFDYVQLYPVRPFSTLRLPTPPSWTRALLDRYLSYFGNGSYTFKSRYIFSGSMRWDGSNLFGVKTNQKGTPLWSVGGSWNLSKEDWFRLDGTEFLRLRATYGSAGNVNKQVSAYPVIERYYEDFRSGLPYAILRSIGNPSLRWENVKTLNLGLDWHTKGGRFTTALDYYVKYASDLIGADMLPPSTGVHVGAYAERSNLVNYADMKTKGFDLQISSRNLKGQFQWNTTLLLNVVHNTVTNYKANESLEVHRFIWRTLAPPVVGKSRDMQFALPWYGLSADNGYPIVFVDGEESQDYAAYYRSVSQKDLQDVGLRVPPFYGSLRNQFSYKELALDFMLSWKSGHVFNRSSQNSSDEFVALYHLDYFKRWQKPGDELHTDVPAKREIDAMAPYYTSAYYNSELLRTKGDLIRLQDITLSYTLPVSIASKQAISGLKFYAYARNLGILWKSNKQGIDPDYIQAEYVVPKTFAFGLQLDF